MALLTFQPETVKELFFGGAVGLFAGIASRQIGVGLAGALFGTIFVAFRAAIFDGQLLATWSPLAIDDTSFTTHLKRKVRREACSSGKLVDLFIRENAIVFAGFGGAFMISTVL